VAESLAQWAIELQVPGWQAILESLQKLLGSLQQLEAAAQPLRRTLEALGGAEAPRTLASQWQEVQQQATRAAGQIQQVARAAQQAPTDEVGALASAYQSLSSAVHKVKGLLGEQEGLRFAGEAVGLLISHLQALPAGAAATQAVAAAQRELGATTGQAALAFQLLAPGVQQAWTALRAQQGPQQAAQNIAQLVRHFRELAQEAEGQRRLAQQLNELAQNTQRVQGAYQTLTGTLGQWLRAGLAVSAEGQRLGFVMSQISFEVAGLFTPAIHASLRVLQELWLSLRNLSEEQTRWVQGVTLAGVMSLGWAAGLGRLGVLLQGVSAALQANPLFTLAGALLGLSTVTEEGRQALGRLLAAFGRLAEAVLPLISLLAEVFTPVVAAVAPIVEWLANLVASLEQFKEILAAATVSLVTFFATFNLIKGVIALVTALRAALIALNATLLGTPIGWIAMAAALVAGGLAYLFMSSQQASAAAAPARGGGHARLTPSYSGGPEAVESAWMRIQQNILRMDTAQITRERQLTSLQAIERNTDRLVRNQNDRNFVGA
jgi:hypothetical protein